MRLSPALILVGCLASPAHADILDAWCSQVNLPSSIALCSDPELRALTIARQHAFDAARGRIGEAQFPVLAADQNAWVASYPKVCGLAPDTPPPIPLPPQVRDCMASAGRSRIAYLNAYGSSSSASAANTAPAVRVGPGFDCATVTAPLARLIRANADLSKTDLRFNQAYFALRQQLDPAGQGQLEEDDREFLNSVSLACGIPESGPVSGSPDCVATWYDKKCAEWLRRLSGPAYEEASRPVEQNIAIQSALQEAGFFPTSAKIDGVFGPSTRVAKAAWRNARGRPATGVMGDADAALFQPSEAQIGSAQPAAPIQPSSPADRAVSSSIDVQFKEQGGVYRVPVRINDAITLDFTVDSGASEVLIPADVVLTLFRTRTLTGTDFRGEATYVLSDGSKLPSQRFTLRELRVGDRRGGYNRLSQKPHYDKCFEIFRK